MGRGVQREPKHEIKSIYDSGLIELLEKNLKVFLEYMQITDAILDELRPDQLPRVMPETSIGCEDT